MKNRSVLGGVPAAHSAFERARLLQDAAATVGFDWPDVNDILLKIREELAELERALDHHDEQNTFEELGDLLFALTNLARRLQIDPAAALEATNQKFIRRFQHMEQAAWQEGSDLALETLTAQMIRYRKAWLDDQPSDDSSLNDPFQNDSSKNDLSKNDLSKNDLSWVADQTLNKNNPKE